MMTLLSFICTLVLPYDIIYKRECLCYSSCMEDLFEFIWIDRRGFKLSTGKQYQGALINGIIWKYRNFIGDKKKILPSFVKN